MITKDTNSFTQPYKETPAPVLNKKTENIMKDCVYTIISEAMELKNRNKIYSIVNYLLDEITFKCLTKDQIDKLVFQTKVDQCLQKYEKCNSFSDNLNCITEYNKCISYKEL